MGTPRPGIQEYNSLWSVVVKQNGFIAFVLCPPATCVVYRYFGVGPTFPSLPRFLAEFIASALVYDLWFWALHRMFHLPRFYRFHQKHHEWKAPCAFEGAYLDA